MANELARKAKDPTASLKAFNFLADYTGDYNGPNSGQDDLSLDLTFRPVIPFTAFGRQNILRLTLPFRVSGRGNEGLGAVSIFDLVVFDRSWLTSWAMAGPLPRAICIGRMISTGQSEPQRQPGCAYTVSPQYNLVDFAASKGWSIAYTFTL